jgi:hypothetical protein
MFSIYKKNENDFDKIILQDENAGAFAEIIPACSAMLHSFSVNGIGLQTLKPGESSTSSTIYKITLLNKNHD